MRRVLWTSYGIEAQPPGSTIGGGIPVAVLTALSVAVLLVSNGVLLPGGLDLAVVAATALAAGGLLAAYAWARQTRYRDGQVSVWDVAGTCVFVGFAALIFHHPVPGLDFPTP
jgi:hypothetical protein